jgi:hypothetical protein
LMQQIGAIPVDTHASNSDSSITRS